MRWRLIRRRLSISAPKMAVRSHLPWPLRWAVVALMLGFSGALALWAFDFGRNLAGLKHDGGALQDTVVQLRQQLDDVRRNLEAAQSVANSADSLLKTERVTQQRLAEQVKSLEAENLALKDDLGFFERLLPASADGLSIRGLLVEPQGAGQWHYQLLLMQQGGRKQADFTGRIELLPSGLKDGRPWIDQAAAVAMPLSFKQYRRVEGQFPLPPGVVVKQVQVRVLDASGAIRASQSVSL
jgi:hypothetical protein